MKAQKGDRNLSISQNKVKIKITKQAVFIAEKLLGAAEARLWQYCELYSSSSLN